MERFSPPATFRPTAEQVRALLERDGSGASWRLLAWLPLAGMVVIVLLSASSIGDDFEWLLWLLLLAMLAASMLRVRWAKGLEAQMTRLQELSLERRTDEALALAWRLFPRVRQFRELRGQVAALLAHNLDQAKAFDAAIVAYDHLIQRLPENHPAGVRLRIDRVVALLASDQLIDADNELRRLRGVVDSIRGSATAAAYRLAALFQQVRTNHFGDAYQQRQGLLEDLRPLGIDAGYGHALMALCCRKAGDGTGGAGAEAETWWWRATLLLTPAALAARFDELAELATSPAARRPAEAAQ